MIIPLYVTGGVLFLLFLHLWYGGALVIQHDVRILVIFEKGPHVLIAETSLGNLECWLLWDMNENFITIFDVVSHYMVFLHQSK